MADFKTYSDEQLILLLKEGDERAFEEIYDRYAMMIYFKVNQMLRDEDSSQDLVQDLFTSIWNKPDHIRPDTNLAGYLYVASRNRVLNLIKKVKVRSDYLTEIARFSTEVSYQTMEHLDERELVALIGQEVSKLPPKMREVFQLSRTEDLSHKEIAAKLGISEHTVRKQVQNALHILRGKLSACGPYGIFFLVWFRNS